MKILAKKVVKFLGMIFLMLIVIITISFINHRVKSAEESKLLSAEGVMVRISGRDIHVYCEGGGQDTLVFLSGGGTCSPMLDFKSLYSLLSGRYRIGLIEKAGYGFSEDATTSRDMETILEESRKALQGAGLKPPYILVPHSMSGIEALYWAQKHPGEVQGIIGLDMAVPSAYEDFQVDSFLIKASSFGARIGITRFFPGFASGSAAIKYGTLTESEKDIYRALFYRGTLTKAMQGEIKEIKTSAKVVDNIPIPDIPMLLFISSGEETGWDKDQWMDYQRAFIIRVKLGKSIELSASHYVHNIEPKIIADEIIIFIEDNINQ